MFVSVRACRQLGAAESAIDLTWEALFVHHNKVRILGPVHAFVGRQILQDLPPVLHKQQPRKDCSCMPVHTYAHGYKSSEQQASGLVL